MSASQQTALTDLNTTVSFGGGGSGGSDGSDGQASASMGGAADPANGSTPGSTQDSCIDGMMIGAVIGALPGLATNSPTAAYAGALAGAANTAFTDPACQSTFGIGNGNTSAGAGDRH